MGSVVVDSPAKLNLFLSVGKRRKDSYHNIVTLFERIDLKDRITLTPLKEDRIRLISNSKEIPLDERNLVYKAALLLKKNFNPKGGVSIRIETVSYTHLTLPTN